MRIFFELTWKVTSIKKWSITGLNDVNIRVTDETQPQLCEDFYKRVEICYKSWWFEHKFHNWCVYYQKMFCVKNLKFVQRFLSIIKIYFPHFLCYLVGSSRWHLTNAWLRPNTILWVWLLRVWQPSKCDVSYWSWTSAEIQQ